MNILADENIPQVHEAFAALGTLTARSGREISPSDLQTTDALLVRSVTRVDHDLLSGTPVRFVASATAGLDHIDADYLQSAGITFAHAPGSNALSAAEYVIAALCYWSLRNARPLDGLSLGVIGCGQVGSRVVRLAQQLGLRCVRNDPPLAATGVAELDAIDAALACDIVTLHVPLTTDGPHATRTLLSADRLAQLKPGAVLINASRGEVIDEAALLRRVTSQRDLTLMLDVWHNEPAIQLPLLAETLLATPHIAGYSTDAKLRGTEMIYRAYCDFLGREAHWQPRIDTPMNAEPNDAVTDIRERVLRAYPIDQDDARLRRVLHEPDLEVARHFDQLRKRYPIRREYSPTLLTHAT
ncbi:MAG TPA: hypothetical protein DD979_17415 [Gammaproteobacteria bacterium]|jgi:erythronate-4-phosphate dehydrogenase|nr:hypothetical protein [Gammaproteobacteria bacterium]